MLKLLGRHSALADAVEYGIGEMDRILMEDGARAMIVFVGRGGCCLTLCLCATADSLKKFITDANMGILHDIMREYSQKPEVLQHLFSVLHLLSGHGAFAESAR